MSSSSDNAAGPDGARGSVLPGPAVPIIIVAIGCVWAIHYVWHTGENSYGDQDTVLFINFLIWPLVGSAIAVAISALRGAAREPTVGLSDPRRIILVLSLPIYAVALVYGGFVLASFAYVVVMVRLLGVQSLLVLLSIGALVVTIAWVGFATLMSVPLPLWPRGVAF